MTSTKKKTTPQKTTPKAAKQATAKQATVKKTTSKNAIVSPVTDPKEVMEPKTITPPAIEAAIVEPKATSTKTAMRKTSSRVSQAMSQEIIHSVVFTRKKQDKELLEAIEQELDASVFANFDELCKEALYQFLWEDESQSIQPQLDQLEESIVTKNATAIKQLSQQLRQIIPTIEQVIAPLTEQLEQLQTQVESLQQQFPYESQEFEFVPRLEIAEVELESSDESTAIIQPAIQSAVATIEVDRDPFLDRLSALLEDF